MWRAVVAARARREFVAGLCAGLLIASAGFLLRAELAVPKQSIASAADTGPAREHPTSTAGDLSDAVAASVRLLPASRSVVAAWPASQSTPGNVAGLLASAEQHRRKREFKEACAAYAALADAGAMTADSWADYADAQASMAGRLAGAPAEAIARALALDPRHPKALWLEASLAHEQRRYREALAAWQRLLAVVPPDSSDARIVEANIAEATRLAAG